MNNENTSLSKDTLELLNVLQEGFLHADKAGKIIRANTALSQMFAYQSAEDMIGISLSTFFTKPKDEDYVKEELNKKGKLINCKLKLIRKNGSRFWALLNLIAICDKKGNTIGLEALLRDISELQREETQTESKLEAQKNDATFELLIKNSPDLLLRQSVDSKVIYASPQSEAILGYTPEEVLNLNIPEQIHPDDVELALQKMHTALKGEVLENFEYRFTKKNGAMVWLNHTARPIIVDNEIIEVHSTVRDISKGKRAELALKESEKMRSIALNGAGAGLWSWNIQTGEDILDDQCYTIFGYTEEELKGEASIWERMIHADDRERIFEGVQKHFADESSEYSDEYRMKCKNGDWIWVHVQGKLVERDSDGNPCRMAGIVIDIDEHKQAKQALKQSEEILNLALAGAGAGLWSWNIETGEDILDENWCGILGYKQYELKQEVSTWESLIHPDDKERIFAGVQKHFEDESAEYRDEYRLKCKNGDWKWIYATGKLVERDVDGNPYRMTGIIIDIDELKQAEQALRESEIFNRSIVDNSFDCIKTLDLDGNLQFMSKGGIDKLEIKDVKKYLGTSWFDLFTDDERKLAIDAVEAAKSGKIGRFRSYIPNEKGKPMWWDAMVTSIANDQGKPDALLAISRDITDERLAEEALKNSKNKLEKIIALTPIPIIITDVNFDIEYYNDKFTEVFGYTLNDISTLEKWWQATYPDENYRKLVHDTWEEAVLVAMEKNEPIKTQEWNFVRKDGKTRIVQFDMIPLEDSSIIMLNDVTERKQAEQALKEKNDQFETIIKGANLGWWDWNITTGAEIYNEILAENLGYKLSEIKPHIKWWEDKIHTDDVGKVSSDLQEHFDEKTGFYENKHRLKTKDGEWKWFHDYGKVVERDSKGNALRMIGTLRDIDYEERAREKVEENKKLYEDLVQSSHNLIWKCDLEWKFTFLNSAWESTHGYKVEEMLGRSFSDFQRSEVFERDLIEFSKHLAEGPVNGYETTHITKDGVEIPLIFNALPLFNSKGEIIGTQGTAFDISKLKQTEIELIEAKELLNETGKVAKVGGWEIDFSGNTLAWTDETFRIHEIEKDEQPDVADAINFYHPEDRDLVSAAVDKAVSLKLPFSFEARIITKKGNIVWVRASGKTVERMGALIGIRGSIQDITHRKQSEIDLIKAKDKAEESDRLKSAFLANMSHEIRTPMNGILGFTDLLKEPDLSGEQKEKYIEIIQKSGDRMLDTVNDIIDISKIDARQVEISKVDVSICDIFKNQYEFFREEAALKGIELRLINKLSPQSLIISDKVKLDSIISNLVKNAVKYTDEGSIEMYCYKQESELVFKIVDTGIGISNERIHRIFNRFEQADIEDFHAREGSGLGLAISKAYVELLGGKIGVVSKMGKGSEFWFTLPWIERLN